MLQISHDFKVHITVGLDPCLMKLLYVMLGDENNKVALATAILKEHTDNLSSKMSSQDKPYQGEQGQTDKSTGGT